MFKIVDNSNNVLITDCTYSEATLAGEELQETLDIQLWCLTDLGHYVRIGR